MRNAPGTPLFCAKKGGFPGPLPQKTLTLALPLVAAAKAPAWLDQPTEGKQFSFFVVAHLGAMVVFACVFRCVCVVDIFWSLPSAALCTACSKANER